MPARQTAAQRQAAWEHYQTHSLRATARAFHMAPDHLARVWRAEGRAVRSVEATWQVLRQHRTPSARDRSVGWYYATHSLPDTARAFGLTDSGVRCVLRRVGVRCRQGRAAMRLCGPRGMAERARAGTAIRDVGGRFRSTAVPFR